MEHGEDDDIRMVSVRELVRQRPNMFIGTTDVAGLLCLVVDVIETAFDLALHGLVSSILVTVHSDGSIEVVDDGPGLDLRDDDVRSWFDFDIWRPTADRHQRHIYLPGRGVGGAVVNFFSSKLSVTTWFEGSRLGCVWTKGGSEGGEIEASREPGIGTGVRFWPDLGIFDGVEIPVDLVRIRVREPAALQPGLTIALGDERFRFDQWEDGLASLVEGAAGLGGVEHLATLQDGTDLNLRLALVCDVADAGRSAPRVFVNYRDMPDEGEVHRLLRSELDRLESMLPGERRLMAVLSITMVKPELVGPTRQRFADQRASEALAVALEQNGMELERLSKSAVQF